MKTADEWRQDYYMLHGRPITPCSFLADILASLEEWQEEVSFLRAQIESRDGIIKEQEWDLREAEQDLVRAHERLHKTTKGVPQ